LQIHFILPNLGVFNGTLKVRLPSKTEYSVQRIVADFRFPMIVNAYC